MKNLNNPLRTLVSAAVLSVLATNVAQASGFSLYGESSGANAGNYGAGSAAEAADASTGWYNPAGLSLLHDKQVVFGGTGIFPNIKVDGTSTFATQLFPQSPPLIYSQTFKDVDGSYNAFVPMGHVAVPISERTTVGVSLTAPFGLATDWADNSPVRYSATFSELITATLSPEIGSRVHDNLAIGAGLDIQFSRVKFNQMIGVPTVLDFTKEHPANALDSSSLNKGTSWGLGFHVGVLGLFNDEHTRVGLNYQSRVRHTFNGRSELRGPLANNFDIFEIVPEPGVWRNNDLFSNPIEFPDVITLSAYQDVNDRLALLGSVVYTGWSVFNEIELKNVPVPFPDASGNISQRNLIVNVPENFHDSWRVALGANYRVNEKLMLRVGGGYDQTPTENAFRNVRLPDAARWAASVGAHYQMKPSIGFDIGYTHLFAGSMPRMSITQPLPPNSSYTVNSQHGGFSADLVGGQVVWVIDKEPEAPMK